MPTVEEICASMGKAEKRGISNCYICKVLLWQNTIQIVNTPKKTIFNNFITKNAPNDFQGKLLFCGTSKFLQGQYTSLKKVAVSSLYKKRFLEPEIVALDICELLDKLGLYNGALFWYDQQTRANIFSPVQKMGTPDSSIFEIESFTYDEYIIVRPGMNKPNNLVISPKIFLKAYKLNLEQIIYKE